MTLKFTFKGEKDLASERILEKLGPTAGSNSWTSIPNIKILKIVPEDGFEDGSIDEKAAQTQWEGALIRTARQGGPLSKALLSKGSNIPRHTGSHPIFLALWSSNFGSMMSFGMVER